MVFFTCNKCGESLKKKDVEKHSFTRCRGPPFLTCVDCLKDFREDYAKHTLCVSEDARYSAKGLNGLKAQPKTKQQIWVETVHDTIQEFLEGSGSSVKPGVRQLMDYLKDLSSFPDKHKTFTNFIKNARRGEPQENIDFIWSLFEKARTNLQAKLAAERAAAEQAKRKAKEEKEAKEGKQNSGAVDSSSSSDSSDEDDDKKTKKEKLNKKMKQLTVDTQLEGNEDQPSTSTTETGLNNELKSEKKKKKKKKSKGNYEEPETVDTPLSTDSNDPGEKKKKKKRELSESESVINMNVASSVQNGEKGKQNKKKKKSNSVCEPPEVQDIVENDGTGNDPTEENDKENSEETDKKLSKKERKERKKREKYEAQLKDIESNKSNEEADEGTEDKAADEVTDDTERKKSKSKVKMAAQDPGTECGHDVKEKKTKKNKKRQREDDQISKLTTEDNHTNKKMKDNGVNGDTQDGAESLATEGSAQHEFQWDKTILQLLESQDGKEMAVKKLCKKVVNEYLSTLSEDAYVDDVKINSKFHKKLAKMHNIVVLKDKARIKTSRD